MNKGTIWKNLAAALAVLSFCGLGHAATIILTGTITQSTADTGVPAVQNLSLNNIADGDGYSVQLNSSGGIDLPAMYSLTSLSFTDAAAGAMESSFVSGSLTLTQSGATDAFSVLGCLASCALGNQLALEFSIPAAQVNSIATAAAIPALLPMDLLEDGGDTDIQGTVHLYSYSGPAAGAPEPGTLCLAAIALLAIGAARRKVTRP